MYIYELVLGTVERTGGRDCAHGRDRHEVNVRWALMIMLHPRPGGMVEEDELRGQV